ncbi:hypothetical protein BVY04_03605, partial [bacterium M21]
VSNPLTFTLGPLLYELDGRGFRLSAPPIQSVSCNAKRAISTTHFCARMPSSWQEVKDFLDRDVQDQIIEFTASNSAKKKCKAHDMEARRLSVRLVKVALHPNLWGSKSL